MKRKIVSGILILALSMLIGCNKETGGSDLIINEETHSICYAPLYVAIEKGYFAEEGLKVRLTGALGSEKTKKALAHGECDIGILGTEVLLEADQKDSKDHLVYIAQLTQRAEEFLVSRDTAEQFTWDSVKGKTVMNGKEGKLPAAVFTYIVKKYGIHPETEVTLLQDQEMKSVGKEFCSGKGDYALVYEPAATRMELEGSGKVVAALGSESGKLPDTAICVRNSDIERHFEQLQHFMKALSKGMEYVTTHSGEEIAKVIKPQFKDVSKEELAVMVARYLEEDTWKKELALEEGSISFLRDILEDAGALSSRIEYENLVNTTFTEPPRD